MSDENAPEPKPARPRHHRTAANLFRIAGGLFALVGILSAIDARWSLSVTFLSLCVVFISVGQIRARKAQQEDEASSGGSAKQPDAK